MNLEKRGKRPSESVVEMTELVIPNDTNLLGNLLGGTLMHWIDIAGAMAASRHSNSTVATASVDSLVFKHPVKVGELVILRAKLSWVGRTSMEVRVDVYSEDYKKGTSIQTNQAFLVFVALDDNGKPIEAPPLILETDAEKKEFEAALKRREIRL